MKIQRNYRIGDSFKLSSDAIDNYGAKYAEQVFHVSNWADHYCTPAQIPADRHGHPGFDSSAGSAIYSSELPFDVYEWEMERV